MSLVLWGKRTAFTLKSVEVELMWRGDEQVMWCKTCCTARKWQFLRKCKLTGEKLNNRKRNSSCNCERNILREMNLAAGKQSKSWLSPEMCAQPGHIPLGGWGWGESLKSYSQLWWRGLASNFYILASNISYLESCHIAFSHVLVHFTEWCSLFQDLITAMWTISKAGGDKRAPSKSTRETQNQHQVVFLKQNCRTCYLQRLTSVTEAFMLWSCYHVTMTTAQPTFLWLRLVLPHHTYFFILTGLWNFNMDSTKIQ